MTNSAFNLFLLLTTLSQLKDTHRVLTLFVESISSIFPPYKIRWSETGTSSKEIVSIDVCTRNHHFGYIFFENTVGIAPEFPKETTALLENACQMLAVVLENLQQEQYLTHQNLHLETLVQERTKYLQQKTDELDRYFSYAQELFCIADTEGFLHRVNKQWESVLGYKTSDLEGSRFLDLVHPDDVDKTLDAISRLKDGRLVMDFVNRYRHQNGSYRTIEWRSFPDDNRIYAAARDITEKQKMDDSLLRAQRLESISVLAGGIAHDFNNLLGGVFGFLDLAHDSLQNNEPRQKTIKYLDQATGIFERAQALTLQLLTFSKGGTPNLRKTNLGPTIEQNVQFALSGSNVSCNFSMEPNLWLCNCDENQIGQAIDNLVINAKHAMPNGGMLLVTTQNIYRRNLAGDEEPNIYIQIQDHGTGIPQDVLPKIFDPFFSTKTEGKGHGLGLTTVFSIIKRHGGWIDVESKVNEGTTFHIYLPAVPKKKQAPHRAPENSAVHRGKGVIVVMDDERFIRDMVSEMLTRVGYTVIPCSNYQETIDQTTALIKQEMSIRAYLLDLTVPGGKGGVETAAAIRNMNKDAIIIAMSGYANNSAMAEPQKYGFTDSLLKPFLSADLKKMLAHFLTLPSSPN